MSASERLPREYYQSDDVVALARALIGCVLYSHCDEGLTAGRIVETEAYSGRCDRACHAYLYRRTRRTEVFFQPGGVAYVYLCYGIHTLFNIITNVADQPDAVLVRAVEPLMGIEHMLRRRKMARPLRRLTAGPGCLTQALGIQVADCGTSLDGERIWLERDAQDDPYTLTASPRVGIDYAGEDALLPWRFRLADSPWTSPAR